MTLPALTLDYQLYDQPRTFPFPIAHSLGHSPNSPLTVTGEFIFRDFREGAMLFRGTLCSTDSSFRPRKVIAKVYRAALHSRAMQEAEFYGEFEEWQGARIPCFYGIFADSRNNNITILEDLGQEFVCKGLPPLAFRSQTFKFYQDIHDRGYEIGLLGEVRLFARNGEPLFCGFTSAQRATCVGCQVEVGALEPLPSTVGCLELYNVARQLDLWIPRQFNFYGRLTNVDTLQQEPRKVIDLAPSCVDRAEAAEMASAAAAFYAAQYPNIVATVQAYIRDQNILPSVHAGPESQIPLFLELAKDRSTSLRWPTIEFLRAKIESIAGDSSRIAPSLSMLSEGSSFPSFPSLTTSSTSFESAGTAPQTPRDDDAGDSLDVTRELEQRLLLVQQEQARLQRERASIEEALSVYGAKTD